MLAPYAERKYRCLSLLPKIKAAIRNRSDLLLSLYICYSFLLKRQLLLVPYIYIPVIQNKCHA